MKDDDKPLAITIFECKNCSNAHIALLDPEGNVVFSAGLPPEIWARIFMAVAQIEARHATKQ